MDECAGCGFVWKEEEKPMRCPNCRIRLWKYFTVSDGEGSTCGHEHGFIGDAVGCLREYYDVVAVVNGTERPLNNIERKIYDETTKNVVLGDGWEVVKNDDKSSNHGSPSTKYEASDRYSPTEWD